MSAALNNPRPVVLESIGGLATLVRECGRESEVLVLSRTLSEALRSHGSTGADELFLSALWRIAETSPEHLLAGRLRRTNTLH